jgi:hypothetical protein
MRWTRTRPEFSGKATVIALAICAAGCGMQLETGYQYRALNASTAERRGYYAPAFSPEKSAVEQEKKGSGATPSLPPH